MCVCVCVPPMCASPFLHFCQARDAEERAREVEEMKAREMAEVKRREELAKKAEEAKKKGKGKKKK